MIEVTIMNMRVRQGGKSAIGNIIVLAMIGFGIWLGIQFIPQKLEEGAVSSLLDDVQQAHNITPIREEAALWRVVDRQLSVNEMRDMRNNMKISHEAGGMVLRVSYERDLNLLFTTMTRQINKNVVLN